MENTIRYDIINNIHNEDELEKLIDKICEDINNVKGTQKN